MVPSKHLSDLQRQSLWKWRWLGIRNGTPAFRISLFVLGVTAFALAAYWILVR
jgi:hypothetical protein